MMAQLTAALSTLSAEYVRTAPPEVFRVFPDFAAELADIRRLVSGARCGEADRLAGLWHAAGLTADGLLGVQTAATLQQVYGPKAHGAWFISVACATMPMIAFMMFSSNNGLMGGRGSANYAAANVCLDSLAVWRRMFGSDKTRNS